MSNKGAMPAPSPLTKMQLAEKIETGAVRAASAPVANKQAAGTAVKEKQSAPGE